jgi:hypothetical protein
MANASVFSALRQAGVADWRLHPYLASIEAMDTPPPGCGKGAAIPGFLPV